MARPSQNQDHQSRPNDVNEALRVAQALHLRRMGYTYAEIASQVGYADHSGARKAIKRELAKIVREEAKELKAHLVQIQLDRIEYALRYAVMPKLEQGKDQLFAVDRMLALLRHQADLLGLYPKPGETEGSGVRREYIGIDPALVVGNSHAQAVSAAWGSN